MRSTVPFQGISPALYLYEILWRKFLPLFVAYCFFLFLPAKLTAAETHSLHGKASWYGLTEHGKRTASGERFNAFGLTAAHRTLPFGTVVRIFNLKNHSQILLRINDRGPFVKGRIVDVSRRAAEYLKIARSGLIDVAVEVISNSRGEALNRENGFYVHISDAKTPDEARLRASRITQRVRQPALTLFSLQGPHAAYAVCLGPYETFSQAERVFAEIEKMKIVSHGIIEASLKGGDIPRHVPPFAWVKDLRPKKKYIHRLVK
ncbi:MAG: septal ring lytic transglycosylase RlpA family protein [Desulfovibrio sp.]|jgi:rare lipoprotein A|nr:septal ring lytic transglycosylase RlpA family protein [Desulfovibrio sp.]